MEMDRFACPPWFECRCVSGAAVSRSTMMLHRRRANKRRRLMSRGLFRRGPSVPPNMMQFNFQRRETLEEHPTDWEDESVDRIQLESTDTFEEITQLSPEALVTINHDQPVQTSSSHHNTTGANVAVSEEVLYCSIAPNSTPQLFEEPCVMTTLPCQTVAANTTEDETLENGEQNSTSLIVNSNINEDVGLPSAGMLDSSLNEDPGIFGTAHTIGAVSSEQYQVDTAAVSDLQQETISPGTNIDGLWEWIYENKGFLEIQEKHGLEVTVMDDLLQNFKAPCKSWKTIRRAILVSSGLYSALQTYAACPGHMLFIDWNQDPKFRDVCLDCGRNSTETDLAMGKSSYISLIPRIRRMVLDEKTCSDLYSYLPGDGRRDGKLYDVCDGSIFHELCHSYGGYENMTNDIFLGISMDGFDVFKNTTYDIWTLAAINLNLPPHKRYLPRNILPLSFIPGPRQPTLLQSFIIPLIMEIQTTHENGGIEMQFHDGSLRQVRIHMLYFSGDQPAVSKLAGLNGPNGKSPCRDCKIHGHYSNHYYFPSRIHITEPRERTLIYFNLNNLPYRSEMESKLQLLEIEGSSGTAGAKLRTEYGIREKSLLCTLPSMHEYRSFPQDIMHTFLNVQRELLRIIVHSNLDDVMCLPPAVVQKLDQELESWKHGISSQIATPPRRLSKFSDWKAAELKMFSLSYAKVLLDGYLPNEFLTGIELFANIVSLSFQAVLVEDDISHLKEVCVKFVRHFETKYFRYSPQRVSFCKSTFHALLHLAEGTKRYGPLFGVSQFWMERYIGWTKDRMNARNRAAESMTLTALYGEAFKSVFSNQIHDNKSLYDEVEENGGMILLGPKRSVSLAESTVWNRRIKRHIADYLVRKFDDLSIQESRTLASTVLRCELYSRARFNCGSDTQTAGVCEEVYTSKQRRPHGRPDWFVAVEMEEDLRSCDVYYGRIVQLMKFRVTRNLDPESIEHEVAVIEWAKDLKKGNQLQVWKHGSIENAFSSPTMESVSIIRRLIGAVEHSVPRQDGYVGRFPYQLRTYFIDDLCRSHCLLIERESSIDGIKRSLKGF